MKVVGMASLMAAALVCAPAWAQATSGTVTVTGLNFSLVDLDSGDGVSPSLTWSAPSVGAYVDSAFETSLSSNPDHTWLASFVQYGSAIAEDVVTFMAPVSASYAASQAFINAGGLSAQFETAATGSFETVIASINGEFSLSANTELVITGILEASIQGPSSIGFNLPAGTPADFAALHSEANAYGTVSLFDPTTYEELASEVVNLYRVNYTPSTTGASVDGYQQTSGPIAFELHLANTSGNELNAGFSALAVASGQQIVNISAPIPEADTYTLMLLGIGVLGLVFRRRSR